MVSFPPVSPPRPSTPPLLTHTRHMPSPYNSPEQVSRMWVFLNKVFYREGLLALLPTSKLEDHASSAVRDCLFNLFAATLLIGGRSSIRNLRTRHAVVTGTHYMAWVNTYKWGCLMQMTGIVQTIDVPNVIPINVSVMQISFGWNPISPLSFGIFFQPNLLYAAQQTA